MTKIIVLIGISGSGKSTRAKEIQKESPNSIIVNRDKLREMLFGYTEDTAHEYYSLPNIYLFEKQISSYQDHLIKNALKSNTAVIIDATHVKLRYINEIKKKYADHDISFELIECDPETAFIRCASRRRGVDRKVILAQHEDLKNLKRNFDFASVAAIKKEPLVQNIELPPAYIFDIDGTLAKMTGRSPYDYSRVYEDICNVPVENVFKGLQHRHYFSNCHFIICTGRDGACVEETKKWLADKDISYDELHIRPVGDARPDYVVKEEMWRDISKRFNILAMFDDRKQVVDHARRLGFTVFQVDEGDF